MLTHVVDRLETYEKVTTLIRKIMWNIFSTVSMLLATITWLSSLVPTTHVV